MRHLKIGDTVRMTPIKSNEREWKEATVTKTLSSRSYEVETQEGRTFRRNRRFLRKSMPSTHSVPPRTKSAPRPTQVQPSVQQEPPSQPVTQPGDKVTTHSSAKPAAQDITTTRSGRQIKMPARYQD